MEGASADPNKAGRARGPQRSVTRNLGPQQSYCQMLWAKEFRAADFLIPSS